MSGTLKIGGKTLATHDTAANEISFHSDVMATTAQVQGAHTTFNGSHSDTATTINLASVSGISAGDYVVGEGIATGTTVSSVGASSVVISAGLDTDGVGIAGGEPISFYKSTKALSPGTVAGGLCRAWVNFNGSGTVAINAAHNVSSITDDGLGLYTVNFATAMPDTNYCLTGSGSRRDAGDDGNSFFVCFRRLNTVAITTSAAPILTTDLSASQYGNLADPEIVCCAFFR